MLGGTELISQNRDGSNHYYLHDGQGSVRALTDENGHVTDRYRYAAFGELIDHQGITQNTYLYRGQQFDLLTGLYSLRARDYDPTLGRFLTRDPAEINLKQPLELNRYVYAQNDPIDRFDPTGLTSLPDITVRSVMVTVAVAVLTQIGIEVFTMFLRAYFGICIADCSANNLGAIGPTLGSSGLGTIPKPKNLGGGVSEYTSLASAGLSRLFPQRLRIRIWAPTLRNPLARTTVLGRIAGRWVPIIGWGLFAVDIGKFLHCASQCHNVNGGSNDGSNTPPEQESE